MNTIELKQTIQQVIHELTFLRRKVEILEAQMSIVEVFNRATLGARPEGRPMSCDIIYNLRGIIDEIDKTEEAEIKENLQ